MLVNEIRKRYLEFFKQNGHIIIPSASLIPENDPSVLFTTAGMHPLVPFLLGEKHPAGKRLVNFQKCVRTGDIDEVGDQAHLTFFEMLGNWSLGDYGKAEAIKWSFEFLTDKKWLNLDKNKLAVSVFAGDKDCPFDQESYDLWKDLGILESRIKKLGKDDNWWPAGGNSTGPQGPCTEMFYWTGPAELDAPAIFDPQDPKWFEIWNDVFMEFEKTADGQYHQLKQKNVDTGMGLERTAAVLQGKKSVYEIETFKPLMDKIKSLAKDYQEESARIIVDHLQAAVFIMADDIVPSNLKQGYVVRKLIRRAIRHAKKISIPLEVDVTTPIVNLIIDLHKDIYPELKRNKQRIINELNKEENNFEKTLEKGIKYAIKIGFFEMDKVDSSGKIIKHGDPIAEDLFELYTTYGFPPELAIEELENSIREKEKLLLGHGYMERSWWNQIKQKVIDKFNDLIKKHQNLSRTAAAGMFKGGLANHSEQVVKYHTATHLLHQALREVLGSAVEQKGSNINEERLRFDFSHPQKMTEAEIKKVENIVNEKIKQDLPVICEETNVSEAKKQGAIGLFGAKYGEKVKVYSIGPSAGSGSPYSREICGGPHVEHLGVLGKFKIIKEEASSSGIRRIKAVLE